MTERRWRILTALLAVMAALVLIHQVERFRAVRAPGGWSSSAAVTGPDRIPRIQGSRWVLSPGAVWLHEAAVSQWYLRASLQPGAVLWLRHGAAGPGVRLSRDLPTVATGTQGHTCEGQLPMAGAQPMALVFERTQDGYTWRSGENRIACSASELEDATPQLEVSGSEVELVSIGVESWPSGLPMSSLGWLGGVALVGFFWMLLLEWERHRRVPWPVVILTGLPCLPAAISLWASPATSVSGVPLSVVLVLGSLALKGISIGLGGSAAPSGEE